MRAGGWGLGAEDWRQSFAMAPMDIYLENVWHKHRLNPMRLTLCLAVGSDRIISEQGDSLLELPLNWYVMTQIVYVYHFHQSQFRDIFGEEACSSWNFLHFAYKEV